MGVKSVLATFVLLMSFAITVGQESKNIRSQIMTLSEVKPGMRGHGFTVFSGVEPQRFEFVVVGIDDKNAKSLIKVELSGGPNNIIKEANVIAGMSGSPLLINNKVIGSVRATVISSKIPYAAVQPIEDMLDFQPEILNQPNKRLISTIERVSDKFKIKSNLELKPGSAYSVCAVWGDVFKCGTATITLVDAESQTFYAQGHATRQLGVIALPAFPARILKVIPRLDVSTKDSVPDGPMIGSIIFDGQYGQIGKIGILPKSAPVSIKLNGILKTPITLDCFIAYHSLSVTLLQGVIADVLNTNLDPSQTVFIEARLRVAGQPESYFTSDGPKALLSLQEALLKAIDNPDSEIEGVDINMRAKPVVNGVTPQIPIPIQPLKMPIDEGSYMNLYWYVILIPLAIFLILKKVVAIVFMTVIIFLHVKKTRQ